MTPFIAQQAGTSQIIPPNLQQMQQQFQQFAAAAAAPGGGEASVAPQNGASDFRMNPFTGGFFLPPNQYQEMMQQYLQTLMLQAGNAPPIFSEVCYFQQSIVGHETESWEWIILSVIPKPAKNLEMNKKYLNVLFSINFFKLRLLCPFFLRVLKASIFWTI